MRSHRPFSFRVVRFALGFTVLFLLSALIGAITPGPRPSPRECVLCDLIVLLGEVHIDSDRTANCVTIGALGEIHVQAGVTLTLTGPEHSTIDGSLVLRGSGSVLRIAESDHTLQGLGRIVGRHNAATVEIDADRTLTLSSSLIAPTRIEGALEIRGLTDGTSNGRFVNKGMVEATLNGGILLLHPNLGIGAGSGVWKVNTANAILSFETGSACGAEVGDLYVDDGVLFIHTNITLDDFEWDGGVIDGIDGQRLRYDTYNPGSRRSNPADGTESCGGSTYEYVDRYPNT